jgi:hypothetical protein
VAEVGSADLIIRSSYDTKPVVTLWDAGSNNTLDLSGFKDSPIINLKPIAFLV